MYYTYFQEFFKEYFLKTILAGFCSFLKRSSDRLGIWFQTGGTHFWIQIQILYNWIHNTASYLFSRAAAFKFDFSTTSKLFYICCTGWNLTAWAQNFDDKCCNKYFLFTPRSDRRARSWRPWPRQRRSSPSLRYRHFLNMLTKFCILQYCSLFWKRPFFPPRLLCTA